MEISQEETQRLDQAEQDGVNAPVQKKSWAKRRWIWLMLLGLAIAIIGIVFVIIRPGPGEEAPRVDASIGRATSDLNPGAEARLYIPSQKSIMMAADESAVDDLINAISARGDEVQNLIQSGKVFTVPNDTRVRIVETRFPKIKVRIIEGDRIMSEGWVAEGWIR